MAKRKKPSEDNPLDQTENYNDSDDTFGLPEIEYEPIKRDEPEESPEVVAPTPEPEPEPEPELTPEPVLEEPIEETPVEEPVYESTTYETSETSYESTYEPTPEPDPETVEEGPAYVENSDDFDNTPPEYSYTVEESSPLSPKVLLGVILGIVLIGGGLWYFMYYKPKADEERRQLAEKNAMESERLRRERAQQDSLQRIADARAQHIQDSINAIPPKPEIGTIETLSGRTGRYFVVVASALDDDLLMDFANTLSKNGVSSKIIPPHGKVKFFRLTIADGESFDDAQSQADGLKADYGDKLWVTRY